MATDPEGDGTDLVPVGRAESGQDGDRSAQPELFPLLQTQLDIERLRIESQDRRTEAFREAVRATDAAEQRQHEFHMRRLENSEKADQRRHQLARGVLYWGGLGALLVGTALLVILFFGDERQSGFAFALIKALGMALGGGGALHLLQRGARWLFER